MKTNEVIARHYASCRAVRIAWRRGVVSDFEALPKRTSSEWWIAPLLLDIQVNGFYGVDFQSEDIDRGALETAVRGLQKACCGRFLLTLVTDRWDRLISKVRRLRDLRAECPASIAAAMVGWHVEGPFLSAEPGFCGAHNPSWMIDPEPVHIRQLREVTRGDALLLTIAPERNGALDAIRLAVKLGAKVSLGHTNASKQMIEEAIACGATCFTHLGNGCPQELDRHDNILWRVLDTPGLAASLIPDGAHLTPAPFRLIHRLMPPDSIIYVTDAMAGAGMPPGRYTVGDLVIDIGPDRIARMPGRTNLAGSTIEPIRGVFSAAEMLGVSWREAWRRFSLAPAEYLALPCSLGIGQRADFCLLRVSPGNILRELRVFFGGEEIDHRIPDSVSVETGQALRRQD